MNVTTYGFDLAQQVFQVHWVELDTGEVKRKTLRQPEVSAFLGSFDERENNVRYAFVIPLFSPDSRRIPNASAAATSASAASSTNAS